MAGLGTETDRIEKHTCIQYMIKYKRVTGQNYIVNKLNYAEMEILTHQYKGQLRTYLLLV